MSETRARKNRAKNIETRLGQRIRDLREKKVMSHAELSRRAEVSPSHLTRIEAGRQTISIRTAEKLAKALDVPTSELFESVNSTAAPATQRLYKIVEMLRDRDEQTLESIENILRRALELADRNPEG